MMIMMIVIIMTYPQNDLSVCEMQAYTYLATACPGEKKRETYFISDMMENTTLAQPSQKGDYDLSM